MLPSPKNVRCHMDSEMGMIFDSRSWGGLLTAASCAFNPLFIVVRVHVVLEAVLQEKP